MIGTDVLAVEEAEVAVVDPLSILKELFVLASEHVKLLLEVDGLGSHRADCASLVNGVAGTEFLAEVIRERGKSFMLASCKLIANIISKDKVLSVQAKQNSTAFVGVGSRKEILLALELEENFH